MGAEDVFRGEGGRRVWNMNFSKNLNDWELEEYEALLQLLSNVQLSDSKDRVVWKLKKNVEFTIKSFYNYLVKRVREVVRFPAKQI